MPYYRHPAEWSEGRLADAIRDLDRAAREVHGNCGCSICQRARVIYQDASAQFATHASAVVAHAARQPGEKVTFMVSAVERDDWQSRERGRFQDGTYMAVPWEEHEPNRYDPACRFPHISINDLGLIAYTENDEKGVADRQTRVRPGRYLKQFFSDWPDEEIQRYASLCAADQFELKIARTAEDIIRVYVGGPQSCMSHAFNTGHDCKHNDCADRVEDGRACHAYASPVHPISVYGNSDLGVAYYGNIDHASARAIVWPDRKLYGRIYGNTTTLRALLERAGYRSGSMAGAKVRAILDRSHGEYVLPFVDGISNAAVQHISGQSWIVLGSGPLDAQSTSGLAGGEDADEDNDDWCCAGCNNYFVDDCASFLCPDRNSYCESCYHNTFAGCEYCQRVRAMDDMARDNDGVWMCESCQANNELTCDVAGCSNCWIEQLTDVDRDADVVDHICPECADTYRWCAACNRAVPRDNEPAEEPIGPFCPTCNTALRDTVTMDLLEEVSHAENAA